MDPAQRKKYVQGWKQRKKKKKDEKEKLAEEAMEKAKKIANLLTNKYKVEQIILFGSLAENNFRKESDIDLALVNFDKKQYLQIFNDAYDIASPFKIDLLPLEDASDSVKKRILSKGVKL